MRDRVTLELPPIAAAGTSDEHDADAIAEDIGKQLQGLPLSVTNHVMHTLKRHRHGNRSPGMDGRRRIPA